MPSAFLHPFARPAAESFISDERIQNALQNAARKDDDQAAEILRRHSIAVK